MRLLCLDVQTYFRCLSDSVIEEASGVGLAMELPTDGGWGKVGE